MPEPKSDPKAPKPHILFVDDEQDLLDGIRVGLRRQRKRWTLEFACGSDVGMQRLDAPEPVDVVISDMKMPGADGAEVLARAAQSQPDALRLALTGEAGADTAMRALQWVHQWISKPVAHDQLVAAIEGALEFRSVLSDPTARAIAGSASRLPSAPRMYQQAVELLSDPLASAFEVAEIAATDPAVTAKMLQLVNSSFFSLASKVTELQEAVAILGFDRTRQLLLTVEVFGAFTPEKVMPGFTLDTTQLHAITTAGITHQLLGKNHQLEHVTSAAMLHDVGLLLLLERRSSDLFKAVEEAEAAEEWFGDFELGAAEIDHASLGAYLLGAWGLPLPVVDAALHHNDADTAAHPNELSQCIQLAQALAWKALCDADMAKRCLAGPIPEALAEARLGADWQKAGDDLGQAELMHAQGILGGGD